MKFLSLLAKGAFIKHSLRTFATSTLAEFTSKPIILLDVDGVINCDRRTRQVWDCYKTTSANSYRTFKIIWAPAVIDKINHWSESGLAEVRWLTTWNELAQQDLAAKLGLRHFELARDPKMFTSKEMAAKKIATDNPTRPIVWIDDEMEEFLTGEYTKDYFQNMQATLYVKPDENEGLSPTDIKRIDAFLAKPHQFNNYFEIVPSMTSVCEERVFCR